MLTTTLIHPDLLQALASCGHGDTVLIADGNYPLSTEVSQTARIVRLGYRPGVPSVTDVLDAVSGHIAIEHAEVMSPGADRDEPPIFAQFRKLLGSADITPIGRFAFYDRVRDDARLRLAIGTGELQPFANILLTVGARQ